MGIVNRVRNICLSPITEWPVIANEGATTGGLLTGYAAPLVAMSVLASLIGSTLPLGALGGFSLGFGLGSSIVVFLLQLCFVWVLALIIDLLAPTFGGQKNSVHAMKVAVYSLTPAWVAGLAQVIPFLGSLIVFLGCLYGLYLMYVGLSPVMKSPQDKAAPYAIVVTVVALVIGFILSSLLFAFGLAGAMGAGALGGALGSTQSDVSDVQFDKDSPLGRLQEMGKAMEKSGAEMEAAQKAGDGNAAAAAAMTSLGALFGGGRRVEPLALDQLKSFLPDTFAGLARQGDGRAEKNGLAGMSVSEVEARYGDGADKTVMLEITDSGGMSGLMGMASWAGMASEKSDDTGSEKTARVNGRMTHERDSKNGTDEFRVVVGERFMVSAKSSAVDLAALKGAVGSLDLSRLESMKDVGVQKP